MHSKDLLNRPEELQKSFLLQNRIFLDAVRAKMPLEEIILQYDKVKSLFETMKNKHASHSTELV